MTAIRKYIIAIFLISCLNIFAQDFGKDATGGIAEINNELTLQAHDFYDTGQIDKAEHLALKRLDEGENISHFEKSMLFKLLAFCAIANDDEETSKRHFISALRYNPSLSPDPLTWSPKIRRVFRRASEEYFKQMEELRRQKVAIEAHLGRRASLRSLYLPGSGQVMKGQILKGYIAGTLFWGSFAGFIYGQATLPDDRESYLNARTSTEAVSRWEDYRDKQYMVNITGIVALAVYGYSFFDALWSMPSDVDSLNGE